MFKFVAYQGREYRVLMDDENEDQAFGLEIRIASGSYRKVNLFTDRAAEVLNANGIEVPEKAQ